MTVERLATDANGATFFRVADEVGALLAMAVVRPNGTPWMGYAVRALTADEQRAALAGILAWRSA